MQFRICGRLIVVGSACGEFYVNTLSLSSICHLNLVNSYLWEGNLGTTYC